MAAEQTPTPTPNTKMSLSLSLDFRVIAAVLAVVIMAMLFIWKPWTSKPSDRTVSVTGQATLKAEPDEYVFSPYYEIKAGNKNTALAQVTKKSNSVVEQLKKLGVEDKSIKTNSDGYNFYGTGGGFTYSLRLTITINDKDLAQKVQDQLVKTGPTGSVTPRATFSTAKQKELENQARDQASKDARAKADQSAKNLGFKVGGVKTVTDGAGFSGITPIDRYEGGLGLQGGAAAADTSKLNLQPGQNDLNYSVTVVYYVK